MAFTIHKCQSWYHPDVTEPEVVEDLLSKGEVGSFLVWLRDQNPVRYVLSVRRTSKISHIRIRKTEDFYDLEGGEKFATLTELIVFYMGNEGRVQERGAGAISLRYPLYSPSPTSERWYHCCVSGKTAETLLMKHASNGGFLVRDSLYNPGDYALSVRRGDQVVHVAIKYRKGIYQTRKDQGWAKLSDLVTYYHKNPIVDDSGIKIQIKKPLNATYFRASAIQERLKRMNQKVTRSSNASPGVENDGFSEEFESLQRQKQTHSCKKAQKPENQPKNRYPNVLPYDHTRIVLKDGSSKLPGSDYINANLITVKTDSNRKADMPSKKYIATQGCLHQTVSDFWRMVWQEKCSVIVMLTKLLEKQVDTCIKYWPEKRDVYGKVVVEVIQQSRQFDCIVRRFELKGVELFEGILNFQKVEATREVLQYHYMVRGDEGQPWNTKSFLAFCQQANNAQRHGAKTGPLLVHCSDGIGRTGCFIAIDIIMNQIIDQGVDCFIDVHQTIELMRSQRSWMVSSLGHYKFVHSVIKELVQKLQIKKCTQYAALYSHTAQAEDEVSFQEGDIIDVEQVFDLWLYGTVRRTQQKGLIPANYVEKEGQ